jgi:hypothetical protein
MGGEHRKQDSMLIEDIESVHLNKHFAPVSSSVWLQALHQTDGKGACALEPPSDIVVERGYVPTYWECRLIGGRTVAIDNEIVGQEIKGRSQVVNTITDKGAPLHWDAFIHAKAVEFLLGLRVIFCDDGAALAFKVGFNREFEVTEMFLGPVNLYAAA